MNKWPDDASNKRLRYLHREAAQPFVIHMQLAINLFIVSEF
ncbi:hypothetical protein [Paenibacillus agricola]|nr:hypothetical protein [Paenibacillus agricola]